MKYQEIIQGKHYKNKDEIKAEQEFHLSRIMWAIVNDEVHYTISKLDHVRWLNTEFNIDEEAFENVIRGYIRINDDESANIVYYRGINHKPTDISDKHLNTLIELCKNKLNPSKIYIYSGVKVGKIGEVWPFINFVKEINI